MEIRHGRARQLIPTTLLFALVAARAVAGCREPQWQITNELDHTVYGDIAAADVNHDGRPDFLGISYHALLVSLTGPNGTFESYGGAGVPDPVWLRTFAVTDFDNDGNIDAIAADETGKRIFIFKGAVDGTFTPTAIPLDYAPYAIAAADFDGDNHVDLAVTAQADSTVRILTGDGHGVFADAATVAVSATHSTEMVAADVDGDGSKDLVLAYKDSPVVELLFGHGDHSFEAPLPVSVAFVPQRFSLADLDNNGRLDIVSVEWQPETVSVAMSSGVRTFGVAQSYPLSTDPYAEGGSDVVVADFNGDSLLDIAAVLYYQNRIAFLRGKGDGVFDPAAPPPAYGLGAESRRVVVADFDLDGRPDLMGNNSDYETSFYLNRCGDSTMSISTNHSTINVTQSASVRIDLAGIGNNALTPTGSMVLKDGTDTLATQTLTQGSTTFTVANLQPGDHTLVATYNGDADFSSQTKSLVQHVTAETTRIVFSMTSNNKVPYGSGSYPAPAVLSSTNDTPTGSIAIADNSSVRTCTVPNCSWPLDTTVMGAHTVTLDYSGDATHPPSHADFAYEVVKATPTIWWGSEYTGSTLPTKTAGIPFSFRVEISGGGVGPTGVLSIRDSDGTELVQMPAWDQFVFVTLSPGVHYLSAKYDGDEHFTAASSAGNAYRVVPSQGFTLDAYPAGDNIQLNWSSLPGATSYTVYRQTFPSRRVDQLYNPSPGGLSFTDRGAFGGTLYLYQVVANGSNGGIVSSNIDSAMFGYFSASPVRSGMPVLASDFTDLLSSVNSFRSSAALAPIDLSDQLIAGGVIHASHLRILRDGLDEARATLGLKKTPWTTPAPSPGSAIRAVEIEELRDGMR